MACVYVISEGKFGPVKVGVAARPDLRVRELQVGNPKRLTLVDWWRFGTRAEAFAVERDVLDEMAPYRLVGEWIAADEYGMRAHVRARIEELYPS